MAFVTFKKHFINMKKIKDIEAWLNLPPDEKDIMPSPFGGLHIPIEKLRDLLDVVSYSSRNYHWSLYKDGYARLCVAASIELDISYLNSEGVLVNRTFVGACNFALLSIDPIDDWNATAKSMCEKNAAIAAAKKFGRALNTEIVPKKDDKVKVSLPKSKPDIKIIKQFEEAVLKGDKATITMLSNIYDIKTKEVEDVAKE